MPLISVVTTNWVNLALMIVLVIGAVIMALGGSAYVMWRILTTKKQGMVDVIIDWFFFVVLLAGNILLVQMIVSAILSFPLASAAENPVPVAPPAVAEKPAALCPMEFNIDDSAWAMSKINEFVPQKISDDLVAAEHIRFFSYFPDSKLRIFVGIKKLWNPDCVANLYSYGSMGDADGKRVLGVVRSYGKINLFLLTQEGKWESGDDWETFTTDCGAKGCNLTFVLYRNKEPVASRTLFIRQFSYFREPVE